jgi:hypothetical protein
MIQAPKDKSLYTKVLCIESKIFIDGVWGDCSIIKGEWYTALILGEKDEDMILVRFGDGLCPHMRNMVKTDSEIRDEKIKSIIN